MESYANHNDTNFDTESIVLWKKFQDRFKESSFEGNWLWELERLNIYNITGFLDVKQVVRQKNKGVSREAIDSNFRSWTDEWLKLSLPSS